MSEWFLSASVAAAWVVLWSMALIGFFFVLVIAVELLKRGIPRETDADRRAWLRRELRKP